MINRIDVEMGFAASEIPSVGGHNYSIRNQNTTADYGGPSMYV
jgi:hypothetical protein